MGNLRTLRLHPDFSHNADTLRLVEAFAAHGLAVGPADARSAWEALSRRWGMAWMPLPRLAPTQDATGTAHRPLDIDAIVAGLAPHFVTDAACEDQGIPAERLLDDSVPQAFVRLIELSKLPA